MLSVSNVTKTYATHKAVKGISFSVAPGEIVGIIGPNGAGKSTTLKMICGLLEPTSGSVTIKGLESTSGPKAREHLGYVPEDSPVYDDMSVEDYLLFFAGLYEIPSKIAKKKARDILASLDFTRMQEALGNLSKGMKRKVMIARSLLHDPELLIYDEPASGLDPVTTRFIIDYIKSLKAHNKAIVLSGHNLFQMEQLCDRIILIKEGKVHFDGTVDIIKKKALKYKIQIDYELKGANKSMVIERSKLDATLKKLLKQKVTITNLETKTGSLEDAFLALTT